MRELSGENEHETSMLITFNLHINVTHISIITTADLFNQNPLQIHKILSIWQLSTFIVYGIVVIPGKQIQDPLPTCKSSEQLFSMENHK